MKSLHKDVLIGLGSVGAIALIIVVARQMNQREEIVLDLSPRASISEEHIMINEVLVDTEQFVSAEEAQLTLDPVEEMPAAVEAVSTEVGILPAQWASERAPDINEATASPHIKRLLAASAVLREEKYTDPQSDFNLSTIEALREARMRRNGQKETNTGEVRP